MEQISDMRKECIQHIEYFAGQLPKVTDVLDIGIAGDVKPGGNYYLFTYANYETMDIVASLEPTHVGDVCHPPQELHDKYDLVILSNTIEHVFEKEQALQGCLDMVKPGGQAIIDCPWMYPYHTSADSDDYWRISATALRKLMEKIGFKDIEVLQGTFITTGLGKK